MGGVKNMSLFKMKNLKNVIKLLSVFIIIVGFIMIHINPDNAIRTHLFLSNHPIAAFQQKFAINEPQYKMDKDILDSESSMIYRCKYEPIDKNTENEMCNFKVKKVCFLYFAEGYGEG